MRLVGVELHFDDLDRAKRFYEGLGLAATDSQEGRFAQFGAAPFLCVERKGSESYPSRDKAVVFFEVPDLAAAVERLGRGRFARVEEKGPRRWAVLHDPEGHNVMLIEARR
jgi:predicted enzyme related to lactoylglutathione lyase